MSQKKAKLQRQLNRQIENRLQERRTVQQEKIVHNHIADGWYLGYWNGEQKASYRIVNVLIQPVEEPKMHWQNAFAGEIRQAVEIDYDNSRFFIDNGTGQGLYKVTIGLGSPSVGHASIGNHISLDTVPHDQWQLPDKEKHQADLKTIEAWQQVNYPEEYERMQQLKATAIKFTNMSPEEKVKHINENMMNPKQ